MTEPLIPAPRWRAEHFPISDRTLRRYELDPVDPFPVHRIGRRKFVRASEAAAWLARRAGAEARAQAETDAIIDEAARTGRSVDEVYAERQRAS